MDTEMIIVHPGQGHRDDFLSCALLIAKRPNIETIIRDDPAEIDMKDPACWVVDGGGEYDIDLHNFDHHQMKDKNGKPALDCAFTLLLKYFGMYEDAIDVFAWVETVAMVDCRGPGETAAWLHMSRHSFFRTLSPIEDSVLRIFSTAPRITRGDPKYGHIWEILEDTGKSMVQFIERFKRRLILLDQVTKRLVTKKHKIEVLFIDHSMSDPGLALNCYRSRLNRGKGRNIHVTVSPDDRGDGWTLYRYDTAHNYFDLDFNRLARKYDIAFAHTGGFIAKTHRKIEIDDVLKLIDAACV